MGDPASRLSRRLGIGDVVVVGLGAMIGTGVFVVWQPAAERAGWWLLLGLAVAAFVAFCNATSSAQLAAVHPQSGGTYVYGRERLGAAWGALAGYAFVVGKLASCAVAAHAVGVYLWPDRERLVAAAAVIVLTAVNLAGIQRTVRATWALVCVVVAVLVLVVVAVAAHHVAGLVAGQPLAGSAGAGTGTGGGRGAVGPVDVLGAAAVLFYSFAGYARIATLGEEVREPARVIPRAVPLALGLVFVLYVAVGVTVLVTLGADGAAGAVRPLHAVVDVAGHEWLEPVVTVAAGVAALAALLALVAGVSRTMFAMAHERDLPRFLAAVHARRRVPYVAETATGALVVVTVMVGDLVQVLSLSAFTVLLYYAVTNAAALRLGADERRWPRWLAVAGLASCLLLAGSLHPATLITGVAALVVAMAGRAVALAARR